MNASKTTQSDQSSFGYWYAEHLEEIDTIHRTTRATGARAGFDLKDYRNAQVLSVHFADGSVFHARPEDFANEHARAGGSRRDAESDPNPPGRIVLPFEFEGTAFVARGQAPQAQIERYTLARLTAPTTLDRLYKAGALFADGFDRWFGSAALPKASMLAGKLCYAYETSALDKEIDRNIAASTGTLLHWKGKEWGPVDKTAGRWQLDQRAIVLFLHGTASSTRGSFQGLWTSESDPSKISPDFAAFAEQHELLAWEHRSLTASPLRNTIELLNALDALLPAHSRISIVSHSRGGMIGELLALALGTRAQADGGEVMNSAQHVFDRAYGPDHPDSPLITPLFDAFRNACRFELEVFVRVACPARGTLLADRRTDLFLSLLLRSVGLAFGTNGVPLWERLNGLVRSLVAARAEAKSLPGLEAMIPGSPLTIALNATALDPIAGKLRVIAGDTRGLGWGGILTFVGNVFYGLHDHDFVVHTHSMFGGFQRKDAKSLRLEDRSINHFGYFTPTSLSRQPLFAVLEGRDDGFKPLADDEKRTRGQWDAIDQGSWSRRPLEKSEELLLAAAAPRKAILVVLPGIMGSELSDSHSSESPVWLSMEAIAAGRLSLLNLKNCSSLFPSSLAPIAYERLLQAASRSFDVVPFAYDWRQSIECSGNRLRDLLERLRQIANERQVPIHLLAHSMGGLVARSALFRKGSTTLWDSMCRSGSRLLMLGTPNTGCYAPVQLLTRHHALSELLAAITRGAYDKELANWSAKCPGLLQLLPATPDPVFGDLFLHQTWRAIGDVHPQTCQPSQDQLRAARAFCEEMKAHLPAAMKDPHVLYVAGTGLTPIALSRSEASVSQTTGDAGAGGALAYRMAMRGDGTVSWESALEPERTWYAPSSHGDLTNDQDLFAAYFDLLTTGRTSRLTQNSPQLREHPAGGDNRERIDVSPSLALPSLPSDPLAYVLGMDQRRAANPGPAHIEVRVVHGSLDYARYPLIVGHYQNDGLLGAAKRIDEKLDGQLGRLLGMKLFSGAALTGVYLRPTTPHDLAPAFAGAVVVGLGTIGELTPGLLADTVTRGALRYAFEHLHRDPWVPSEGIVHLRLSTLLIGTHVQAVTSRDSLASVLQGIWRAGYHLAQESAIGRRIEITEIEVVEIEEDVALDAAYEMKRLIGRQEWSDRFVWREQLLETRDGGLRGYRPGHSDAVWQRLVVRHEDNGGLKFELIAEHARVESTRVYSDVASLSKYIARVSDEGAVGRNSNGDEPSLGRVLYQLLLPQALKSRLVNFDNTVLVLDDKSAGYPWELLTPPEDGPIGDRIRPLAVQAGMVRQRLTYDFRSLPQGSEGWNALVVGAPGTSGWTDAKGAPLMFRDLPGAAEEAHAVTALLDSDGRAWNCTSLQGKDVSFEKVRTAILERPYRIMHLAGHGVVDQWITEIGEAPVRQVVRKTGMLLSHQQVLSAGDIEQMDPVPEFVFVNCCYSGRDGTEAENIGQRNYPVLAASLAMQFIKMGAKAVVAAGWQVDDEQGLKFAKQLYSGLLAGTSFGDAVRNARTSVLPRAGEDGTNTWGAYQCYGDPDWRLPDSEQGGLYSQAFGTSRLQAAAECMSHREFAERILQLTAVAGDKRPSAMLMQLDDLIRTVSADPLRKGWMMSSRVRAAVGEAFRELGDHQRAVEWMQRGARTAYSRLQLRHIELMVDSLSRLKDPTHHARALDILKQLDSIDARAMLVDSVQNEDTSTNGAVSAMSERACLRGSDLLYGATESAGRPQSTLLLQAAEHFSRGYVAKLDPADRVDRRAYALSSAMLCIGLAGIIGVDKLLLHDAAGKIATDNAKGLDASARAQDLLDEIDASDLTMSFWHYTISFELLMARNTFKVAFGGDASQDDMERAVGLLRTALVRWPSPAESESVSRRFQAIELVCSHVDHRREAVQLLLDTARAALKEMQKLRFVGT